MNETINLDSGMIERITFAHDDKTANHIVADLRRAKPDFMDFIHMICFARPAPGKNISEILDDYLNVCKTGITLATPDTMMKSMPYFGMCEDSVYETKRFLYSIEYILRNKNFIKVVFNRSLNEDNRVSIVFVYNNNDGREFIKAYKSFIDRTEEPESKG